LREDGLLLHGQTAYEVAEAFIQALSTPIDNEPQPIMYKLSEAEHDILKNAQLGSVTVLHPTPPTTELTDDAICQIGIDTCHSVNKIGCVFDSAGLVAFAKALLSRKSESEAVAYSADDIDEFEKFWASKGGLDMSKRVAYEVWIGSHKRYAKASPQPSDEVANIKSVMHDLAGQIERYQDKCGQWSDFDLSQYEALGQVKGK